MAKFIGTIGIGLSQLFDVEFDAADLKTAEKLLEFPDGELGEKIDKIMEETDVSSRGGWLNYEVIEVRPYNGFVKVEYDSNYTGGNYHKVGEFALVPAEAVEDLGVEQAFELATGLNPVHIIHYSPDEVYDKDGERVRS